MGRLLLAMFVAAAVAGQTKDNHMVLTADNDGKTVTIPAAGTVTVRLPVQMGTGFSWTVVSVDSAVLKEVGKPRVERSEKPGVGRQETQVFTFAATQPGSTSLKLHYLRAWDKQDKPEKTYSVTIRVE